MSHQTNVSIVEKCLEIDNYISGAYKLLSSASEELTLKKFWEGMSGDEDENLVFWNSVREFVAIHDISYIFESPDITLSNLESIVGQLNNLSPDYENHTIEQQFELAFRLEFNVINELAFESLFQIFSPISLHDPEEGYGDRIKKICEQYALSGDKNSVTILLTNGFKMITRNNEYIFYPRDLELNTVDPKELYGGKDVEDAAKIFIGILEGKGTKAQSEVVIANAGMSLYGSGFVSTVTEGIGLAKRALNSGEALNRFKKFVAVNQ